MSGVTPVPPDRCLAVVVDGQDDDFVLFMSEQNRIGKAPHDNLANFTADRSERVWHSLNHGESGIDRACKLQAQAR